MTHRLFRVAILTLLVAMAGSAAFAQAPSWTYIEAGYLNVDPDNLESGDNVFAGGSLGLGKMFHIGARYIDGDFTNNTDFTLWTFNAGWHGGLGEKGDLFAEAAWTDSEIANNGDDGIGANGGIRWRLLKFMEADGIVHWVDFDTAGSQTSYEARVIFFIWKIGLGAAVEFGDDYDQYNAFIRFSFGKD